MPSTAASFNPCCSGFGSSTRPPSWLRSRIQKFQSLLFWIRLLNSVTGSSRTTSSSSFNPCCSGFGSSTLMGWATPAATDGRFQSLLFWIRLLNGAMPIGGSGFVQVSILVVLDSAPQPQGARRRQSRPGVSILVVLDSAPQQVPRAKRWAFVPCFNPCCSGFGSSTTGETSPVS